METKQRSIRFSLRAMLAAISVATMLLGWEFVAVRNRRATLTHLSQQPDRFIIVTSRELLAAAPGTKAPGVNIIRYFMGDEPIDSIQAHPLISLAECAELAEIFPEAKVGQVSRVNFGE